MNTSLERVAKDIANLHQNELDRIGIFHRTFFRCKVKASIEKKIDIKKYDGKLSFLRDMIGIRITFYFADDLAFAMKHIKEKFGSEYVEEKVDTKNTTEFKPERINLVFRVPEEYKTEFKDTIKDNRVDSTYELQLRTVLSEGWHEVDHDLRYKFSAHWEEHNDLSRMFNGILAALETNDWSIISLFNQLSYRHYKKMNIDAMIRTKFRLRFAGDKELNSALNLCLTEDKNLCKEIFKLEREEFLLNFARSRLKIPLTIDNIVYYINSNYLHSEKLFAITPKEILREIENSKN